MTFNVEFDRAYAANADINGARNILMPCLTVGKYTLRPFVKTVTPASPESQLL